MKEGSGLPTEMKGEAHRHGSPELIMAKHAAKASKGKNNVPHVQGEVMKADALQPFVTTFNGCCFK